MGGKHLFSSLLLAMKYEFVYKENKSSSSLNILLEKDWFLANLYNLIQQRFYIWPFFQTSVEFIWVNN